jgi:hypothetical protein
MKKKLLFALSLLFLSVAISSAQATINAEITRVDFPTTAYLNGTYPVNIWISNTGDTAYNFSVGLTIGRFLNMTDRTFHSSLYCNRDCYNDGLGDYGQTGIIAPGDHVVVTRLYRFRPDVFATGLTYGLIADVFNATYLPPTSALDWHGYPDNITTVNYTIDARITNVVTEGQPSVGDTKAYDIYVRNTGNQPANFYVGLTVGKDLDTGDRSFHSTQYCNRNCYADGIGDYAQTGIIAPGEQVRVTRLFHYDPRIFNTGEFYDFEADVASEPYVAPLNVLDWYGVLSVPYMKPSLAYGIYALSDKNLTNQGDLVTVTSYVYNNGTTPAKFSVLLQLGRWDGSTQGAVYASQQTSFVPICDVDCMVENKGFQTYTIAGRTSAHITSQFIVPDYWPSDSRVDVAIGVYDPAGVEKPLQGRCPSYTAGECPNTNIGDTICIEGNKWFCTQFGDFNCFQNLKESCTIDLNLKTIVYIKNVTFVTSQLTESKAMGKALANSVNSGSRIMAIGFNTDMSGGKFMLWIVMTMIVSTALTIISKHKEAFPITTIMMFVAGIAIGFVPAVFFIIFTLLAAGVLIYFMRGFFGMG